MKKACLTAIGVALLLVGAARMLGAAEPLVVRLQSAETAGLLRGSEMATLRVPIAPPQPAPVGFQLLHRGKPVRAQFTSHHRGDGRIEAVTIDWIDNYLPYETRQYELHYGPKVSTTPLANRLQLVEKTDRYRISNRELVVWSLRKDLAGLATFQNRQRKPHLDYVQATSEGLTFQLKNGPRRRLADRKPNSVTVTRRGPLLCAFRYVYANWPPGAQSTVDLEFLGTKSWLHAVWELRGAANIQAIGGELNLILNRGEKMIDFGAGDFVYTTVRKGQQAVLRARPQQRGGEPPWVVLRGATKALRRLAEAPRGNPNDRLGGWLHVMDNERCTAFALRDFGHRHIDQFAIRGDGRLTWLRSVQDRRSERVRLEFWIHFVTMPVHRGARTSPQAMRSPPVAKLLTD